jgi:flagellar hook-associated protein 3 FlgL
VSSSVSYNSKFRSGEPYTVDFVSGTQLKITDAAGNDVTAEASQGGAFDPTAKPRRSVSVAWI